MISQSLSHYFMDILYNGQIYLSAPVSQSRFCIHRRRIKRIAHQKMTVINKKSQFQVKFSSYNLPWILFNLERKHTDYESTTAHTNQSRMDLGTIGSSFNNYQDSYDIWTKYFFKFEGQYKGLFHNLAVQFLSFQVQRALSVPTILTICI